MYHSSRIHESVFSIWKNEKIKIVSNAKRKAAWKWRRRKENDRIDYTRSFSPSSEIRMRRSGCGRGPRTTADFELDSDRAWNSILNSDSHVEWTKFEFVSSFRIRVSSRQRAAFISFCGVGNSKRVRFYFTHYRRCSRQTLYLLQIFQPAWNRSFVKSRDIYRFPEIDVLKKMTDKLLMIDTRDLKKNK